MITFPLLTVSPIMKVVAALFILCSLVLILIILVQKGRGGGLSGALGGGMASGILGSKTGDFLTWVTIVVVGLFLLLAIVMAKYYKPKPGDYDVPQAQQAPVQQTQQATVRVEDTASEAETTSADANSIGG